MGQPPQRWRPLPDQCLPAVSASNSSVSYSFCVFFLVQEFRCWKWEDRKKRNILLFEVLYSTFFLIRSHSPWCFRRHVKLETLFSVDGIENLCEWECECECQCKCTRTHKWWWFFVYFSSWIMRLIRDKFYSPGTVEQCENGTAYAQGCIGNWW